MTAVVDLAALYPSLLPHVDHLQPLPDGVELGECGGSLCTEDRRHGWESVPSVARVLVDSRLMGDFCSDCVDVEVAWFWHHTTGEITIQVADTVGAVAS